MTSSTSRGILMAIGLVTGLSGCNDMQDQPKFKPLQTTTFYADGRASRMPVPDTVPQGELHTANLLNTGKLNGKDSDVFPFPVTPELLARGQERFSIYCAVCHGALGNGQGMIVQRGFPAPPSYHIDRLRQAPVGHFFDVITNGYGKMYSFSEVIPVNDRWAIIAYIRALQRSRHATEADVPASDRSALENAQP